MPEETRSPLELLVHMAALVFDTKLISDRHLDPMIRRYWKVMFYEMQAQHLVVPPANDRNDEQGEVDEGHLRFDLDFDPVIFSGDEVGTWARGNKKCTVYRNPYSDGQNLQ